MEDTAEGEQAIVLIHDGVRPLITNTLISNAIASVKEHGSAIASVAVHETVVVETEDGVVVGATR